MKECFVNYSNQLYDFVFSFISNGIWRESCSFLKLQVSFVLIIRASDKTKKREKNVEHNLPSGKKFAKVFVTLCFTSYSYIWKTPTVTFARGCFAVIKFNTVTARPRVAFRIWTLCSEQSQKETQHSYRFYRLASFANEINRWMHNSKSNFCF